MLSVAQTMTIARRSIKTVTGINVANIDQNDTLEKDGVVDSLGLRLIKRLACESGEFGVPAFDHELSIEDLGAISTGSTVKDFALKIKEKAKVK